MEIKVFATGTLQERYEHTNDLYCGDYENPDVKYVHVGAYNDTIIIACVEGNEVLGSLSIEHSNCGWMSSELLDVPVYWCMTGLGVHEEHQGKGIATLLVEKQFEVMQEVGINRASQSGYSSEGIERLYHVYERVMAKYPDIHYINPKRKF